MTEQKNERVHCMIERYQKEISGETDWYFRGAIRRIDKDLIRRYCFPALFSALFYDPTPEQLRYIAGEAERMAFNFSVFIEKDAKRNKLLRVQNMMKLAAYEVGKPDYQYWRETLRKDSGSAVPYIRTAISGNSVCCIFRKRICGDCWNLRTPASRIRCRRFAVQHGV